MMKTKAFDCVEMKNEIQAARWREYQAHKKEYPTYAAFIEARARKSAWVSKMRALEDRIPYPGDPLPGT
jgi:hypothetical protein